MKRWQLAGTVSSPDADDRRHENARTCMAKISDAGEFIPHAKKHTARGPAAAGKGAKRQDRLGQLWPEPDWKALAARQRYDRQTLAALAVTYWGLGRGPIEEDCFEVSSSEWPALYDGAIQIVRQVFDEAHDEDLSRLRARARELAGINRLSSTRERMRLSAAGRYGGRTLTAPFSPTPKLAWLGESMADLGWPEDDSCLKTSIGVIALKAEARPMDPVLSLIHI